jgi:putative acetyltransferase
MNSSVPIRDEDEVDCDAVRAVNTSAFDTQSEANLVDALRHQVPDLVSLVAEMNGNVVGHIMFSPVFLSGYPGLSFTR